MNTTFPTNGAEVRPAENLVVLASEIKAEFKLGDAASRKSLGHFRRVGALLRRVKMACRHGEWLPWLEENMPFSR